MIELPGADVFASSANLQELGDRISNGSNILGRLEFTMDRLEVVSREIV